jgi:hypothetical protein
VLQQPSQRGGRLSYSRLGADRPPHRTSSASRRGAFESGPYDATAPRTRFANRQIVGLFLIQSSVGGGSQPRMPGNCTGPVLSCLTCPLKRVHGVNGGCSAAYQDFSALECWVGKVIVLSERSGRSEVIWLDPEPPQLRLQGLPRHPEYCGGSVCARDSSRRLSQCVFDHRLLVGGQIRGQSHGSDR